jgi:hypothetical protein
LTGRCTSFPSAIRPTPRSCRGAKRRPRSITGLLGNPLIIDPATKQIKDPDAIYEATKVWLETFDRKDINKLLPDMPEKSQDPVVENAALMQGDTSRSTRRTIRSITWKFTSALRKTPFYEHLPKEGREALDKHIAEHKAQAYKVLEASAEPGRQRHAAHADGRRPEAADPPWRQAGRRPRARHRRRRPPEQTWNRTIRRRRRR